MESIKDKVTIIGMGCTKFGEHWDKSLGDLLVEAAHEAFGDAGVDRKDIQAAWFGNLFGSYSGVEFAEPLKLQYIPGTLIKQQCATGSDVLRNAAYAIAAGACDIALAIGVEKLKDTGYSGNPSADVIGTNRMTSMSNPAHFAHLASRYFARYGLSPEEGKRMIARVSVKSHHNGSLNPKAQFQREATLEEVMNAPLLAWPLGLFDCCGVSDGAAAAVLTRADMAKSFRPDPVYIKALQLVIGPSAGALRSDYDWTHIEEATRAAKAAYAEAGIKNPREEISMAEVHDCFSITEAVSMEDLGFSPRGRVREDIESGFFDLDGGLPVNPDGGLKCFGHPVGASGLRMLYEMYKQLQGKAGPRQIKNPKLGLTHNVGGYLTGNASTVVIVGL